MGAGNVSYYLKAEPVYDTGGVVEVHNWLVEIMANFGVLTMLGYLTVYLFLFWTLYKCHERKSENQSRLITEGLITAMAGFFGKQHQPKLRIKFIFPLGISLARDRGGQYIEAFTKGACRHGVL